MKRRKFGLTAAQLRILALGLMLLDHIGATVMPGCEWLRYLGRMAFPIFAFQTAEGYAHTHNFMGYCKRLLIFGLVSEIPFDLMVSGSVVYPYHQNVMFTMLLGLLACRAYDRRKVFHVLLWFLAGSLVSCDYGSMGVATVLLFHVFRNEKWAQLVLLAAINWFGYDTPRLVIGGVPVPVQAFAILAMIPIALYSGEKGRGGRALQYGSYVFYPLHMLILGLMG